MADLESSVYTYHCICTELVAATFTPLEKLPHRKHDGAAIARLTDSPDIVLHDESTRQGRPVILKLEDGFEKRYPLLCERCQLVLGYWLDAAQFDDSDDGGIRTDVVYVLSPALVSTRELQNA